MPSLKRDQVELTYELAGSGPPVLFIQGVGVTGEGWRPQVDALSKHDASGRLGELLHIPTLVLSAAHDRIAPPSQGRALAAAIPGSVYEEFAASSHGVAILDPAPVNDRLATFLRSAE